MTKKKFLLILIMNSMFFILFFIPSVLADCNSTLSIETDRQIYYSGGRISFWNVLSNAGDDFLITYWIEDLFGNIWKRKTNTTNTNKKTFTPLIQETDRILVIRNELVGGCDEIVNSSKFVYVIQNLTNNPTQNITDGPETEYNASDENATEGNLTDENVDVGNVTQGNLTDEPQMEINGTAEYNNTELNSTETVNETVQTPQINDSASIPPEGSFVMIENAYLGSDNAVKFGDSFRARVKFARRESTKKTVNVWVETPSAEKLSYVTDVSTETRDNHTITLTVFIKPNCNKHFEEGNHILVISGFDNEQRQDIQLQGFNTEYCKECDVCESCEDCGECDSQSSCDGSGGDAGGGSDSDGGGSASQGVQYFLHNLSKIYSGQNIPIKLKISNNDDIDRNFLVYSYIYKGSKCYSFDGNRTANMGNFSVSAKASKELSQTITLGEIEAGEYKLKIKIKKEERVTFDEITKDITIFAMNSTLPKNISTENISSTENQEGNNSNLETLNNQAETIQKADEALEKLSYLAFDASTESEKKIEQTAVPISNSSITSYTIYESDSEKTKKLTPYFIMGAFAVLCFMVIFFKKF